MALTGAQKAKIAMFLGWSARYYQLDTRLDQAMSAISTKPDSEALIVAKITACEGIDTELVEAHKRMKASAVGSIQLRWSEIYDLRSEGRRHAGAMAAHLGVEIRHDYFGGYGPKGFASAQGMVPGTYDGNYTPQG